jgi:predicted house-cleaning noncanonical NTP pyrophosphatase (MazG superfamily)
MGTQWYRKLVRDRIPEVIRTDGHIPIVRTLSDGEYCEALRVKLGEEAKEVLEAGSPDELEKEVGDVEEVLDALIAAYGLDRERVARKRSERKEKRGGFTKRLFLERVD